MSSPVNTQLSLENEIKDLTRTSDLSSPCSTDDSVSSGSDGSDNFQKASEPSRQRKASFQLCENCEKRKAEHERAKLKRRFEEDEQEKIRQEYERDREMEPGCVGVTDNGRITILDPSYPGREGSDQWEEPRPGDTVFDYLQTINAAFEKRQRRY